MGELSPNFAPLEIEADDDVTLIECGPDNGNASEFAIVVDRRLIVGNLGLTKRGEEIAQINYYLDESRGLNGYLSSSIPALSQYAMEQLGIKHLVVGVHDEDKKKQKKYEDAFINAGFRLSAINSTGTNVYELVAGRTSHPPVRIS